jgi:hypothetical protein
MESKKRRIEDVPIDKPSDEVASSESYKRVCVTRRLNKLDPIMFTPIRKRNTWKFIRPNGERTQIHRLHTLLSYRLTLP